jgi:hypothetical protein
MTASDPAVDRVVAEVLRLDHERPGTARAIIAEIAARLGPNVLKPEPQSNGSFTLEALIG